MITLWHLRRQALSRFHGEAVTSSDYVPDETLDGYLRDAYREIQRRLRLVTERHTADLVAGQPYYDRPLALLDRLIVDGGLRVRPATGEAPFALAHRAPHYIREHYSDPFLANGVTQRGPKEWGWSEADATQLGIWWPPMAAVSGGLIVDYVLDPGELGRLTDQAAVTATVTQGSAAVTLSGAGLLGQIESSDAMGVRPVAGAPPLTWYEIAAVAEDGLTLTLRAPYSGATRADALFVTSQVSAVERARPGLCMFAPVDYAVWALQREENGEEGAALAGQRWEASLARIATDARTDLGLQPYRPAQANRHPALWRHAR